MHIENEELFEQHKWNHVTAVLHKHVMRSSIVSLYVNGNLVSTSKVCEFVFILSVMDNMSSKVTQKKPRVFAESLSFFV